MIKKTIICDLCEREIIESERFYIYSIKAFEENVSAFTDYHICHICYDLLFRYQVFKGDKYQLHLAQKMYYKAT
jgi:hypothetical protein